MRYPILQHIAQYLCDIPEIQARNIFCDTSATTIARYEKYRCWASCFSSAISLGARCQRIPHNLGPAKTYELGFLRDPCEVRQLRPSWTIRISGTNFCTGDFAPPEPEFRAEFWETNFGRPNFWPEFLGRIFWACFIQQKRPPEKFTLPKFTFQNSTKKSGQKFTLHLCRAIWLTIKIHAWPIFSLELITVKNTC